MSARRIRGKVRPVGSIRKVTAAVEWKDCPGGCGALILSEVALCEPCGAGAALGKGPGR